MITEIAEDYVSLETARLLKKKGFDETCYACYEYFSSYVTMYSGWPFEYKGEVVHNSNNVIKCPTLQMAMKWLRKVHNILIVIDYEWECDTTPYYFKIYRLDENGKPKQVPVKGVSYDKDDNPTEHIIGYRDWERSHKDFSSYEEACEASIKYYLENLI